MTGEAKFQVLFFLIVSILLFEIMVLNDHTLYLCQQKEKVISKVILPYIVLLLSRRLGRFPWNPLGKGQPASECQYYHAWLFASTSWTACLRWEAGKRQHATGVRWVFVSRTLSIEGLCPRLSGWELPDTRSHPFPIPRTTQEIPVGNHIGNTV